MSNRKGKKSKSHQGKGLMRRIKEAESKGDIGLTNYLKSKLAKDQKEFEISLEHCQEALNIEPNNSEYLTQMGLILIKLRKFRNSLHFFDESFRIDKKNIDALKGKGFALSRLGQNEEAIECFDKVLDLDLEDYEAWMWKGTALSYENNYEKALECFERALKIKPNNYRILKNKAFTLFHSGKLKDAIEIFDKLLERNPEDLSALKEKATIYFYGNNYEKAVEMFKKVLTVLEKKENKLNENYYIKEKTNSLRKIGASFSAMNDEKEALLWFDKALKINSSDYNALRDKGVSLGRLGKIKEAFDYFEKSLNENEKNAPAWREMGSLLSNLDKENEAIKCFKKAINIESDDYHLYRQMGISLAKLGLYKKAGKVFETALEIKPNDAETLREVGFNHFVQGNDDLAEKYCKQALEIKPNDPLAHLVLGNIEEIDEKFWKSIYHYEKFIQYATFQQKRKYLNHIDQKIIRIKKRQSGEEKVLLHRDSPTSKNLNANFEKIITELDTRYKETLLKEIKAKEEEFMRFLTLHRSIDVENFPSFLVILKRWNSYTPLLPLREGQSKGGGYFLYHNGKGIVIDPGCNFLLNFYQEGFNFIDIDAVIVTHAHIDHTMDLESILMFIDRLNKKIKEKAMKEAKKEGKNAKEINDIYNKKLRERIKKIDLFLNQGTYQKFKPFLCSGKLAYIGEIFKLEAKKNLILPRRYGNVKLYPLKAKHDEILDNRYCLGYVIQIDDSRIGITGDTGWDPAGNIGNQYRELEPDLLIAHIGSIKEEEFAYFNKTAQKERNACFYPNHLGILGVTGIITITKPKLAVISEFGEELVDQRITIAQKVSKVTDVKCLPGDIGLYIRISDLAVFCEVSKQFVPYYKIDCVEISSKYPEYKSNPKIQYYLEDLQYKKAHDVQFNEKIRRKSISKRKNVKLSSQ
jgi:tetratricopeptide (TPR) repeat protein